MAEQLVHGDKSGMSHPKKRLDSSLAAIMIGEDKAKRRIRQIVHKVEGGGRVNPLCAGGENKPKDGAENQLMVSTLFTYGKFKFLDMADLDWEKKWSLLVPPTDSAKSRSIRPGATERSMALARLRFSTPFVLRW